MRALKPRRLKLLPIDPPSAAPIVIPGTLRKASARLVAPCACISVLLITVTDCGMSRSGVSTPPPMLDVAGL